MSSSSSLSSSSLLSSWPTREKSMERRRRDSSFLLLFLLNSSRLLLSLYTASPTSLNWFLNNVWGRNEFTALLSLPTNCCLSLLLRYQCRLCPHDPTIPLPPTSFQWFATVGARLCPSRISLPKISYFDGLVVFALMTYHSPVSQFKLLVAIGVR